MEWTGNTHFQTIFSRSLRYIKYEKEINSTYIYRIDACR